MSSKCLFTNVLITGWRKNRWEYVMNIFCVTAPSRWRFKMYSLFTMCLATDVTLCRTLNKYVGHSPRLARKTTSVQHTGVWYENVVSGWRASALCYTVLQGVSWLSSHMRVWGPPLQVGVILCGFVLGALIRRCVSVNILGVYLQDGSPVFNDI